MKLLILSKNEINIYFNEYIKLKDLSKQLIISPPLNPENPPLISPQGSPSKYIKYTNFRYATRKLYLYF